jgi:hypothetical protein
VPRGIHYSGLCYTSTRKTLFLLEGNAYRQALSDIEAAYEIVPHIINRRTVITSDRIRAMVLRVRPELKEPKFEETLRVCVIGSLLSLSKINNWVVICEASLLSRRVCERFRVLPYSFSELRHWCILSAMLGSLEINREFAFDVYNGLLCPQHCEVDNITQAPISIPLASRVFPFHHVTKCTLLATPSDGKVFESVSSDDIMQQLCDPVSAVKRLPNLIIHEGCGCAQTHIALAPVVEDTDAELFTREKDLRVNASTTNRCVVGVRSLAPYAYRHEGMIRCEFDVAFVPYNRRPPTCNEQDASGRHNMPMGTILPGNAYNYFVVMGEQVPGSEPEHVFVPGGDMRTGLTDKRLSFNAKRQYSVTVQNPIPPYVSPSPFKILRAGQDEFKDNRHWDPVFYYAGATYLESFAKYRFDARFLLWHLACTTLGGGAQHFVYDVMQAVALMSSGHRRLFERIYFRLAGKRPPRGQNHNTGVDSEFIAALVSNLPRMLVHERKLVGTLEGFEATRRSFLDFFSGESDVLVNSYWTPIDLFTSEMLSGEASADNVGDDEPDFFDGLSRMTVENSTFQENLRSFLFARATGSTGMHSGDRLKGAFLRLFPISCGTQYRSICSYSICSRFSALASLTLLPHGGVFDELLACASRAVVSKPPLDHKEARAPGVVANNKHIRKRLEPAYFPILHTLRNSRSYTYAITDHSTYEEYPVMSSGHLHMSGVGVVQCSRGSGLPSTRSQLKDEGGVFFVRSACESPMVRTSLLIAVMIFHEMSYSKTGFLRVVAERAMSYLLAYTSGVDSIVGHPVISYPTQSLNKVLDLTTKTWPSCFFHSSNKYLRHLGIAMGNALNRSEIGSSICTLGSLSNEPQVSKYAASFLTKPTSASSNYKAKVEVGRTTINHLRDIFEEKIDKVMGGASDSKVTIPARERQPIEFRWGSKTGITFRANFPGDTGWYLPVTEMFVKAIGPIVGVSFILVPDEEAMCRVSVSKGFVLKSPKYGWDYDRLGLTRTRRILRLKASQTSECMYCSGLVVDMSQHFLLAHDSQMLMAGSIPSSDQAGKRVVSQSEDIRRFILSESSMLDLPSAAAHKKDKNFILFTNAMSSLVIPELTSYIGPVDIAKFNMGHPVVDGQGQSSKPSNYVRMKEMSHVHNVAGVSKQIATIGAWLSAIHDNALTRDIHEYMFASDPLRPLFQSHFFPRCSTAKFQRSVVFGLSISVDFSAWDTTMMEAIIRLAQARTMFAPREVIDYFHSLRANKPMTGPPVSSPFKESCILFTDGKVPALVASVRRSWVINGDSLVASIIGSSHLVSGLSPEVMLNHLSTWVAHNSGKLVITSLPFVKGVFNDANPLVCVSSDLKSDYAVEMKSQGISIFAQMPGVLRYLTELEVGVLAGDVESPSWRVDILFWRLLRAWGSDELNGGGSEIVQRAMRTFIHTLEAIMLSGLTTTAVYGTDNHFGIDWMILPIMYMIICGGLPMLTSFCRFMRFSASDFFEAGAEELVTSAHEALAPLLHGQPIGSDPKTIRNSLFVEFERNGSNICSDDGFYKLKVTYQCGNTPSNLHSSVDIEEELSEVLGIALKFACRMCGMQSNVSDTVHGVDHEVYYLTRRVSRSVSFARLTPTITHERAPGGAGNLLDTYTQVQNNVCMIPGDSSRNILLKIGALGFSVGSNTRKLIPNRSSVYDSIGAAFERSFSRGQDMTPDEENFSVVVPTSNREEIDLEIQQTEYDKLTQPSRTVTQTIVSADDIEVTDGKLRTSLLHSMSANMLPNREVLLSSAHTHSKLKAIPGIDEVALDRFVERYGARSSFPNGVLNVSIESQKMKNVIIPELTLKLVTSNDLKVEEHDVLWSAGSNGLEVFTIYAVDPGVRTIEVEFTDYGMTLKKMTHSNVNMVHRIPCTSMYGHQFGFGNWSPFAAPKPQPVAAGETGVLSMAPSVITDAAKAVSGDAKVTAQDICRLVGISDKAFARALILEKGKMQSSPSSFYRLIDSKGEDVFHPAVATAFIDMLHVFCLRRQINPAECDQRIILPYLELRGRRND